jgi:hypothetical protein
LVLFFKKDHAFFLFYLTDEAAGRKKIAAADAEA